MKFLISASIFFLLAALSYQSNGQSSFSFTPPMKIPQRLSANFGEIRKNHFHSGIDYRTDSRIGVPVYAIADGYVSRIFVSNTGFGKALYINHGTEYTSVYAHLDSFNPEISNYVKASQYLLEDFSVNLFPPKSDFIIKKGDLIGFSGNSGSSEGPHLHFEVRNQSSEEPINPINENLLPIADTIPPVIRGIILYKIDSVNGIPTISIDKDITIKQSPTIDTIRTSSDIFLGIEAFDKLPYSSNKYFINTISIKIDNNPFFVFEMNRFSFNETRMVNSVIDYAQLILKGREIVRTLKEPNNSLSLISNVKNNGIISLNDNKPHLLEIEVYDSNRNLSSYSCCIKQAKNIPPRQFRRRKENSNNILFNKNLNVINLKNGKIIIPGNSIFNTISLTAKEIETTNGYSNTICVGSSTCPLKGDFDIYLKLKKDYTKKVADIVYISRNNGATLLPLGGNTNNDFIVAKSSEFGCFKVEIDSTRPIIKERSTINKYIVPENNVLTFTVKDNKSGIESIDAYIDGKWSITERNIKEDLFYVKIDKDRIHKNKLHLIEVYASDKVGNIQAKKFIFRY